MTLRIGFAGAGFIAGLHGETLRATPGVAIAAVVDPDGARAETFAAEHGARRVESYEALVEVADAVYICAPNALHASMAERALASGRHVFSEKPSATSPEDARRVREAAGASSGVYQVGFNKRFAPVYRALKERIASGDIDARWAHLKMNRGELRRPPWVGDASLTGGFLYETPVHILDLSCWLFGPLEEVVCRAARTHAEHLDDFAMLLTFRSGLTATFCTVAHTTWLFPYERLEVYGPHTTAVTEEMERVTFQLGLETEPFAQDVSHLPVPERWGYAEEDRAFVAACQGEAPPPVSAADGEYAVGLVDACYRAAETRETVRIADGRA